MSLQEIPMTKLMALALAATFATGVFADEKKPAEPSCKMECCKKSGKSCKDCPECAKHHDKKKDEKKA
jgi:hypothetical protein